jgi:hypothetical protein
MAFSAAPGPGMSLEGLRVIDGARELQPVARPAVLPLRPVIPQVRGAIPVVLRATEAEAAGARMQVGGLRVVDRAIRQLARLRDARVVIATDGSIPLPRRLPKNMERRELNGDVGSALAALEAELGPETATVGADSVWLVPGRFEKAIRVVDAASRREASDAVFGEVQRGAIGIVDRMLNVKIAIALSRAVLANLPLSPALLTLAAGFAGVYGALLIATGASLNVILGFAALQGYVLLEACASTLTHMRLHQSRLAAWLDTLVGDFVTLVSVLAVGRALWARGGTLLDMEMALAAAGMTLLYAAICYRELLRQGEGDVARLRWWFTYGQPLHGVRGPGSRTIKAVMALGRRDVVVFVSLGLAIADQLWVALLLMLIVAITRVGAALVQLFTPAWRVRPRM